MKKYLPHIIIVVVGVCLLFLLFTGEKGSRQFDGRVTFQKRDKIPYGTFVAFQGLKSFFPNASVAVNRKEPGYWDSLSNYDANQALIVVTPNFNASEDEMKQLIHFVENGNDVIISTMNISYQASQLLKSDANAAQGLLYYYEESEGSDLISLRLTRPPFTDSAAFSYPGKRNDFYFYKLDTATTTVLGYDKNRKPNFIHLKAGDGNMYVHLAPMAFTNYFLLHKNNIRYYENLLSIVSPAVTRIVWDEYFINKRQGRQKNNNWINGFMKHPSLRWGLLTAIFALLVYVLLEMRRKQRIIPRIPRPKNESLEFVKTIGRLYHDKGDHLNLSKKMAAYFLEHVRTRYKLATSVLDDSFEKNLQAKTGAAADDIHQIVNYIRQMEMMSSANEKQLAWFHKQLENFYKTR